MNKSARDKTTATPSSLRRLNRSSAVRHMLQVPSVSRSGLARAIGVSPVTAGKIVEDLIQSNVLETVKAESLPTRAGRPGHLISLNRSRPRFMTVQIGVTHTRASVVPLSFAGEDVWQVEMPTPQSAKAWAANFAKLAAELFTGDLWGVLLSVPGIVDHDLRQVLFSPNLHWTEKQDFRELLKPLTRATVVLVQEIQALAMGESAMHPAFKDFLLVDFGNGFGGAAVIGGELYKTELPLNSELGHGHVMGNRRRCGCGAVGCVETLVSRHGLLQSATHAKAVGGKPDVLGHIAECGREPWLDEAIDAAAASIATAMNILGLRRVIMTGLAHEFPPVVRDHLFAKIRGYALWSRFGSVTTLVAPRHRMRGLIKAGMEQIVLSSGAAFE